MDTNWHLHSRSSESEHIDINHRPLLGRLYLVPNQEIIQEQYQAVNNSQTKDGRSINQPINIPSNLSFKDALRRRSDMENDKRRFSSTSNDSELSSLSSHAETYPNDVFLSSNNGVKEQIVASSRVLQRNSSGDFYFGTAINQDSNAICRSRHSADRETRRKSSAYSSEPDQGSWRVSDRRYSRFSSSSSRRDSDQSSCSLRRNSSFNNEIDQYHPSSRPTCGMELVPGWLKLLRLHKYTDLIMSFTYEEMLQLTEEQLEVKGVTKGARRKIINNIQKLLDRPSMLVEINQHLDKEDCNVRKVLTDLEVLLKSPVKVGMERRINFRRRQDSGSRDSGAEVSEDEIDEMGECEGNKLVSMIMTTMRKTCSLLLLSPNTDVKHVSHFVSLLDICLGRDCYQHHQKQLLLSWKHKLLSIWASAGSGNVKKSKMTNFKVKDENDSPLNFPISHWAGSEKEHSKHKILVKSDSLPETKETLSFNKKRLSLQNMTDKETHTSTFHHRYSLPLFNPKISENLTETGKYWDNSQYLGKLSISTVKTEDDNDWLNSNRNCSPEADAENELDISLENLCLSVTENALD